MSKFSAFLLGTLVILAFGAVPVDAAVQYDPILEWNGPYFRVINAPSINQLVDDPATDIPFVQPFAIAVREHAANGRDVVYVADAGNNRIQAFEANATFISTDESAFTFTEPVAAASQWDNDQIYLAQWVAGATKWIVPFSEVVTVDGETWTWVASLTGFVAADKVYTIDYDDATNAPEIQFPASSLSATSEFTVRYITTDDQTGATAAFGLGDVDYGTGNGATPVLTEVNESTSGVPSSWQQVRSLAVIQNETTSTSDDLFVLDAADGSTNQNEELWYVTIPVAGTISAGEAYDDRLTTPYDVAVARSGSSTVASVTPSADTGPFDLATADVSDDSQVTGHTYTVTVAAGNVTITDSTTGQTVVSSTAFANLDDPFLGIPGLSLPLNGVVGATITIATTKAVSGRYLFVSDTGADRIKVISAAGGATFAGDWLPSDAHTMDDQPAGAGLVGATADADFSRTTPATVTEDYTTWTLTAPIEEGSLETITFDPDGTPATWTRVDDISAAGPADEVFEVDWQTGQITFGDGIHGELPPASTEFQFTYAKSPDVLRYGSSGTAGGRFSAPRGIAARWNSSLGHFDVYVCDTGNNRIQKLAFIPEDVNLNIPARMNYVTSWKTASTASDLLSNPVDVVVGADGDGAVYLAVADQGNDRVVVYRDEAAEGAGGSDVPTYDTTLGSEGNTLGKFAQIEGLALQVNGNDFDLFAADAQRNVVQKYEEAPTPTITMTFTGVSALPACFAPTGGYTFSFTVANAPIGGWVDFYYDTASSYSAATSKLCIESGTVEATATSANWSFADTPDGVPADNDSYYLFARLKDASGNTVATDATTSSELFCLDSTLLPTLKAVDEIDGDKALSLQNSLSRVVALEVAYPDSIVACGFKGTFDPSIIEIVGITQGNAWDNTGATNVIFTQNFNNTAGTFEVNSSAVGTPHGLIGNGPFVVAHVEVKAKADAVTPTARFKDGSFAVVKSSSSMTDYLARTPGTWKTQSLDLVAGYLGDLATTASGADSTLPNLRPNPDGNVNFADQMVFTLGWNGDGTNQDPISDLGPATGDAPDLVSAPDGVYDVEDILAFTTMYSWAASNGFLRPAPGADQFAVNPAIGARPEILGADVAGAARAYTVSRVSNPLPGSTIDVDLVVNADQLTGALLTLGYDATQLEPVAVYPGDHLKGHEGNLFFQRGGDGWIEVAASRLDRANPTVSGEGTIATVKFRILGTATNEFDLHYDLRSASNKVLGRGAGQAGPLSGAPATFALFANYPNPVSNATNIVFALPTPSGVSLDVYDAGGRLVHNLAKGTFDSGYHVIGWDGRNASGDPLPAGVYFYQIRANDQVSTRKLILAR